MKLKRRCRGSGTDQRDQMWRVDRAPAGLGRTQFIVRRSDFDFGNWNSRLEMNQVKPSSTLSTATLSRRAGSMRTGRVAPTRATWSRRARVEKPILVLTS